MRNDPASDPEHAAQPWPAIGTLTSLPNLTQPASVIPLQRAIATDRTHQPRVPPQPDNQTKISTDQCADCDTPSFQFHTPQTSPSTHTRRPTISHKRKNRRAISLFRHTARHHRQPNRKPFRTPGTATATTTALLTSPLNDQLQPQHHTQAEHERDQHRLRNVETAWAEDYFRSLSPDPLLTKPARSSSCAPIRADYP